MSKKSILNTLLISSALLGATVADAATSDIKSESKKVTVSTEKAKLYKDSKLKESTTPKNGTVYQVNGYRDINGKHVYRVYQTDKEGKKVYRGYIDRKDTKDFNGQKASGQYVAKKGSSFWSNFYWTEKKASLSEDKVVFAKYEYTLGNGKKYYSMYTKDAAGKDVWQGYTTKSNLSAIKSTVENKYITLNKNTKSFANLYFQQTKGSFDASKGVNFKVTRYYTIGGKKYYSTEQNNGWTGYVDASVVEDLTSKKLTGADANVQVAREWNTYSNHFYTKKDQLKDYKGKTLTAKYIYTYGNGKKYASLYDGDTWLGYANVEALKFVGDNKPSKPDTKPETPKPDQPGQGGSGSGDQKPGDDTSKPGNPDGDGSQKPDGGKPSEPNKPEQPKPDQPGQGGSGSEDQKPGDDTNKPGKPDGDGSQKPGEPSKPEEKPEEKPETPQPGTTLESQIKEVKAEAEKVYLSKDQQAKLDKALEEIGKVTSNDTEKFEKAKAALEQAKKDLATCPTKEEVNKVVEQYNQLKEKCANWKEGQHKDVFSPETEKPFEAALKAIEKVGKANASNGTITKEDLANANKAQEAANNLKFNASLINKKVNDKATALVEAAKKLEDAGYGSNSSDKQTAVNTKVEAAKKELAENNLSAIKNGKWNSDSWNKINTAEKAVVSAGKDLQETVKQPLKDEIKKAEAALKVSVEGSKQQLSEAIKKAEEDLLNNRYDKFIEDKKALEEAIKKAPENGKADVVKLQEMINNVDKIAQLPKDDFIKDDATNTVLANEYATAQKMVENPESCTKQQISEEINKLAEAAKNLKLNVEKLTTAGNEFKNMVGVNGEGGTYYIDKTQTSTMKSSSLATTCEAGMKATTLKDYAAFDKADKDLAKAIKDVQDNCPKMSQVNEAVEYAQQLEKAGFDTKSEYKPLFDKEDCDHIENNLAAAKRVKATKESKGSISKSDITSAVNLKGEILDLRVNVIGLEKINNEAAQYASDAMNRKSAIKEAADALKDAVDKANQVVELESNQKVIIAKGAKDSEYQWNTQGIKNIANAEKEVKTKAEALAKLLKEQQQEEAANKITDDKATLNDPVALCAAIMESDKSDESAKQLAKLLDKVAYPVWSYSTGHKVNQITKKVNGNILVVTQENDPNNQGLVINESWTKFDHSGKGHYYNAIKLLQDYARNTKSVETTTVQDLIKELVNDFQGMRVVTEDLEELVAKATQRDINSNNLVELVEKANEYIANPKLDNWKNIVETTKSLREAIQKAQEEQEKAQEETQKPATEQKGDVITKDQATLKSAPALARTILTSPKANNEAKELAKIVDAAYEVDKNSTGDYTKSISKIDINKSWTEFGGSGHGSYYDALKDLQDYARNTASVKDVELQNDADELVDDMEGLRVLPDYLADAMQQAEKAEKVAKENNVVSSETDQLIQEAKVIVEGKNDARRGLDNWKHINELTAKLKDAAKKLTTFVKK